MALSVEGLFLSAPGLFLSPGLSLAPAFVFPKEFVEVHIFDQP